VWCLRNSFTTPGTYVQAKPFIPVILSDARRSAATKRESKNPEDFSFIHTASGSSHNALRAAGCCFLPFNYHFLAIFGDLGNAPSGSAEIMRLRDSVLSQFAENVLPCGPERRASPAKPGERKSKDPDDMSPCHTASGSSLVNISFLTLSKSNTDI